jgi:hypothetical protein
MGPGVVSSPPAELMGLIIDDRLSGGKRSDALSRVRACRRGSRNISEK